MIRVAPKARAEAEKEGWAFDEVKGTLSMLERLVNGEWDAASFLVVPPGATIRATHGRGNCGSRRMSADSRADSPGAALG